MRVVARVPLIVSLQLITRADPAVQGHGLSKGWGVQLDAPVSVVCQSLCSPSWLPAPTAPLLLWTLLPPAA